MRQAKRQNSMTHNWKKADHTHCPIVANIIFVRKRFKAAIISMSIELKETMVNR
jgi:hypothetical protein